MTDQYSIIPLDDAHEIFHALGIGPESKEYQRWKRPDGFRLVDMDDVMGGSESVLGVDWRDGLDDIVDIILRQLNALGFEASADLGEEGEMGTLTIDGITLAVKHVRADHDDFNRIIAAINALIAGKARYRKYASCEGTDGWWYAVLPNDIWQHLRTTAGSTLDILFTDRDVV